MKKTGVKLGKLPILSEIPSFVALETFVLESIIDLLFDVYTFPLRCADPESFNAEIPDEWKNFIRK